MRAWKRSQEEIPAIAIVLWVVHACLINMVKTLQAKNLSMYDLEKKFNLTLAEDEQFFTEWRDDLPAITDGEKQSLNWIKANYLNLNRHRPMLEDMVKMVVLSPCWSRVSG